MKRLRQFKQRLPLAAAGIGRLLVRPRYAALAVVIAVLFALFVHILINIQFYGPLLTPRTLGTVSGIVVRQFAKDALTVNGMLLIVVSVLQGVSITALIFSLRRNAREASSAGAQAGTSGLTALAAAVGLGCVPCGTSLVLPLVAIFFSGASTVTAATYATLIVLVVAVLLTLFSLYRAGYIVYIHTQADAHDTTKEVT